MKRHLLSGIPLAVLALAIFTGTLQAATFAVQTGAPTTITCDTVLGLSANTVVSITLATAATASQNALATVTAGTTGTPGNPLAVTVVTGSTSVPNSTNYVPFQFKMQPGCKNAVDGATLNFVFTGSLGGASAALSVPIVMHVTGSSATALSLSPSALTVQCTRAGTTDTPVSGAQTVNITSAANGGTAFSVDTAHAPAWLTLGGAAIGANQVAGPTPIALTLIGNSGNSCNGMLAGTYSGTVSLLNPPAPAKLLTVYLQVGVTSTLQASGTLPLTIQHTVGAADFTANQKTSSITVSAGSAVDWTIDPTTVPIWLTPGTTTALTPSVGVVFQANTNADSMAPGVYSGAVHFKVSGALDFVLNFQLQLSQATANLSTADGGAQAVTWTQGTALPQFLITPIATGATIQYTVAAGSDGTKVLNNGQVDSISSGIAIPGLASPFYVNFPQSTFSAAVGGTDLKGSVVLTYNNGSVRTTTVNLTVHVQTAAAQAPIFTGSNPSTLSIAPSGTQITVTLAGSGFSDGSVYPATVFGVLNGANVQKDNNIAANISGQSIVVTITVPASADAYLPFSGAGGPITFAACNPTVGTTTCTAAQTTLQVQVGGNPVIQTVTSASSFVQTPAGMIPPVAPYDIISLFGTNFCVSGNTGCKTSALYGQLDPVTLRYLTTLATPGDPTATQRYLTVNFQTHGGTVTPLGAAPILFATNNQINVIAPGGLFAQIGNTVDIVVTFGYGTLPTTLLTSAPYTVQIVPANPGVFVMTGDGQGDAAAENLSKAGALVNAGSPASTSDAAGDSLQVFVTGLGKPDSTGAAASATTWGLVCMDPALYWPLVPPATSDDGIILQSSLMSGANAPCFKSIGSAAPRTPVAVTIGGAVAPVTFAGWVNDSVAGLYQIDVTVPLTATFAAASTPVTVTGAGKEYPVVVTVGTTPLSSQSGATLFVQRVADMTVSPALTSGALTQTKPPTSDDPAVVITMSAASSACSAWSYTKAAPSSAITGWAWDGSAGTITIDNTASTGGPTTITITAACTTGDTTLTGTVTFALTLQ